MGNYKLWDELSEVMYANVLTSERQHNILSYSTVDLVNGLYERIARAEEFRDVRATYGEVDFWDRLNGPNGYDLFTRESIRDILFSREYSLEYKRAFVGELSEEEVRGYYYDSCAIVPSMFQLSQDALFSGDLN